MNVLTRGVKNTLRSPIRSGAIALMFAISIALIVSMLVARSSVITKINEVKSTAGTNITIRPAGTMGPMGGGDPLTASQLTTITNTPHIASTIMTLTDQLASTDTNLVSSLEFGGFGRSGHKSSTNESNRPEMTPGITITGTTDSNSIATNGGSLTLTSGSAINATSGEATALVGTKLATKNNLSVGSTFTAYNTTFTVSGIYETGSTFSDSGIVMPLKTLQTITAQPDVVSSVTAKVDSSDNVAATVANLKSSLGSAADITSEAERAASSVSSLEGIASLALAGVIAAAIAGATIILLAMVMVVRERRREIGVMKAIGGTDGKVVGQFITEGLTLTILGAIVGMGLGILVSGPMTTSLVSSQTNTSQTASQRQGSEAGTARQGGFVRSGLNQLSRNATQVTAALTPTIILLSLGVTVLIALIGTAIPAWFTARVRPAEVLRTE